MVFQGIKRDASSCREHEAPTAYNAFPGALNLAREQRRASFESYTHNRRCRLPSCSSRDTFSKGTQEAAAAKRTDTTLVSLVINDFAL